MGEGGQRYKLTAITSADVEKKKKSNFEREEVNHVVSPKALIALTKDKQKRG